MRYWWRRIDLVKVLLVDDEPTRRIDSLPLTRRFGCLVFTAASGTEALRLLEENAFDVLLVDLVMPEISGLDLIARVRGERRHSDTPVIAMTAMPSLVREVKASGASQVLVKPFEAHELMHALESCHVPVARGNSPGTSHPAPTTRNQAAILRAA